VEANGTPASAANKLKPMARLGLLLLIAALLYLNSFICGPMFFVATLVPTRLASWFWKEEPVSGRQAGTGELSYLEAIAIDPQNRNTTLGWPGFRCSPGVRRSGQQRQQRRAAGPQLRPANGAGLGAGQAFADPESATTLERLERGGAGRRADPNSALVRSLLRGGHHRR
jgi:hypothetical protein